MYKRKIQIKIVVILIFFTWATTSATEQQDAALQQKNERFCFINKQTAKSILYFIIGSALNL